jgi:phosphoribosylformylglycinamidine synthase
VRARVRITLKDGVLDPQGKAIAESLRRLGYGGVQGVRQGKLIELDIAEREPARASAEVERMCKDLLANPVIETYAIELESAG